MPPILEVEHLSKHFGALAAVNDLSFVVNEGETLGIAGPNGAGKTALFDVITGHSRCTGGVVRFKGEEIQQLTANSICQQGIARIFQIAAILPSQTVLGTILAGLHFGEGHRLACAAQLLRKRARAGAGTRRGPRSHGPPGRPDVPALAVRAQALDDRCRSGHGSRAS